MISRSVARRSRRCDLCGRTIQKGERQCRLGYFDSCRECEGDLPARYEQHQARIKPAVRKLTMQQATRIRELYGSGVTATELGKMFGTSISTVGSIVRGESYRD